VPVRCQHPGKIRQFHLAERLVAQDAGIGAEQVDAAPLFGGAIDHCLDLPEVRHVGAVGDCHAADFANFLDHGFRRGQRSAAAIARAAEIVDDDLGAKARQPKRMRAPETIARAGDDGDAAVKSDCHDCSSRFSRSSWPGLTWLDPAIHQKEESF
jgi:hypothetical protein